MFEVPKTAVTSWDGVGNYTNIFAPKSADIGCPHCNRSPINFLLKWEHRPEALFSAGRCAGCGESSYFWLINFLGANPEEIAQKSKLYMYPSPALLSPFDERINTLSPSFVKIYDQAAKAEQIGLDELSGMGYRRAFEFLIKDWCCRNHPDKIEEIKNMLLGQCIQQFATDTRIKACAERTAWLGNDETHYIRKWLDKDVEDLKTLLQLTIYWIDSSLMSEQYIASMPRR